MISTLICFRKLTVFIWESRLPHSVGSTVYVLDTWDPLTWITYDFFINTS